MTVTGWTAPVIPPHLLAQRDMTARWAAGRCWRCRYQMRRGDRLSLPYGTKVIWQHTHCLLEARRAWMKTETEST